MPRRPEGHCLPIVREREVTSCTHPNKLTNTWTTPAGARLVTKNGKQVLVNFCTDHRQESCPDCPWTGPETTSDREC